MKSSGEFNEKIENRFDTFFSAFDERAPSKKVKQKILGNLDRAGGSLLDQTQYTPNEAPTEETKKIIREFCEFSNWEAELKDF